MEKEQTPRYAPGHELTVHPGDPVPGGRELQERATAPASREEGAQLESSPEDPDEPETGDPGDLEGPLRMGTAGRNGAAPVTMVAQFQEEAQARACAEALRRRGLEAGVAVIPGSGTPAANEGETGDVDPGLSNGVAVGASLGATAGLLAATYVLPDLAGPLINASSLVTTLAGAGLGSFLGGLTDGRSPGADEEEGRSEPQARQGAAVAVRVAAADADAAEAVLRSWEPRDLRVRPG